MTVATQPRKISRPTTNTAGLRTRHAVRCAVARYLHDAGIDDPDVIAAESRRIVDSLDEDLKHHARAASPAEQVRTALERARTELLAHWRGESTTEATAEAEAPVAQWFETHDRPACFRQAPVPPEQKRSMPRHPKVRRLAVLRKCYWRLFAKRCWAGLGFRPAMVERVG